MFVLRAPPAASADGPVFRIAVAELVRITCGAAGEDVAFVASVVVVVAAFRGDFGLAATPFTLPADKNGDAERDTTGGVPTREGGLEGLLMAGLSHDEKKSSSASVPGVEVPSADMVGVSSPMTTSSGYLLLGQPPAYKCSSVVLLFRISRCPLLQLLFVLVRGI